MKFIVAVSEPKPGHSVKTILFSEDHLKESLPEYCSRQEAIESYFVAGTWVEVKELGTVEIIDDQDILNDEVLESYY